MKPLDGLIELLDWCDEINLPASVVTNAPRLDGE